MTQYDNIVSTPVYGPLSHKMPFAMSYHKLGVLTAKKPTPQFFYSGQEPVNSEQLTNARKIYVNTAETKKTLETQRQEVLKSPLNSSIFTFNTGIRRPTSSHMNYIAPKDSSLHILNKKAKAVGKSSYKVGLPSNAPYSTKNYSVNTTKSALNRVRSGGCVAPAKKGAI